MKFCLFRRMQSIYLSALPPESSKKLSGELSNKGRKEWGCWILMCVEDILDEMMEFSPFLWQKSSDTAEFLATPKSMTVFLHSQI